MTHILFVGYDGASATREMTMTDDRGDGGPAFPITAGHLVHAQGMTLRDWFAGQAMAGAIKRWLDVDASDQHIAQWSYEVADAMLAARKEK